MLGSAGAARDCAPESWPAWSWGSSTSPLAGTGAQRDMEIRNISFLQARSIRREVLRPRGPESEVAYPGDACELARHFGAFEEEKLVGVASFLPEPCPEQDGAAAWRLRGMATMQSAQGRGVGGQLLLYGVECVLRQGATVIWCYGRASARTFYERHGFRVLGEEFALPQSGPHYLLILFSGGART